MNISDLSNLKESHYLIASVLFIACVSSGFLILYQFKPELIEKLDIAKIIIFSISLSLPLFGLNTAIFGSTLKWPVKIPLSFEAVLAGMPTIASIYICLFLSYSFSLSFKVFIGLLAVSNFILLVLVIKAVRKVKVAELLNNQDEEK